MAARSEAPVQVSVVVPCYNEAKRLDVSAYLRSLEQHPWLTFVFVDDGSRDGTHERLLDLQRKCPERVRILTLAENQGKAEAVRRGLLALVQDPAEPKAQPGPDLRPELVGFWDADLATPLSQLEPFVEKFRLDQHLEILMGSRVRLLGTHIERKAARHYLGRIAATLATAILGVAIYDTQCGAKLFRATDTLRDMLDEPFLTRWVFDVELLARWFELRPDDASGSARFVRELPVPEWRDVSGSRLRLGDFLGLPRDLLRIAWRYRSGRGERR
jgi:glycosyltransferase involved in cell wall biosynthesis